MDCNRPRRLDELISLDLVRGNLRRTTANQLWLNDMTEQPTRDDKADRCAVLDALPMRVTGWSTDSQDLSAAGERSQDCSRGRPSEKGDLVCQARSGIVPPTTSRRLNRSSEQQVGASAGARPCESRNRIGFLAKGSEPVRIRRHLSSAARRLDKEIHTSKRPAPLHRSVGQIAEELGLYSQRIVDWSMAVQMPAEPAYDAPKMAVRRCRPEPALIHHPDQG